MKFITNIDKDKYDNFVKNHIKSHFLQSYNWGEFARLEKNLTPHYVGLIDEYNNLVCATLLLEKKLPQKYSYFYAPRGFVIDFNNEELLKEFVKNIKEYVKKHKAIFVKIDPDLIINRKNYLNEEKTPDYDKDKIMKILKSIGFKHLGFTQKFETMQPRFSFRIDNNKTSEEIYNNFSKTTKQRIKKAEDLNIKVEIGNSSDINEFYKLMRITENRKDFVTHNEKYYETLYKIFKEDNNVNLFLGKVNIKEILDKMTKELEIIKNEIKPLSEKKDKSKKENTKLKELETKKEQLLKNIDIYNNYKKEYGEIVTLNGHFITQYGDKAWVLYAGNHNILTDTYANYKTYQEHINFYHDKVKIYDQFGTVGNINQNDHLYGLHEFKKKFGGDYVEFIGEFDLILNKPMYFIFTKLVPIYRNIIKKIAKKRNR